MMPTTPDAIVSEVLLAACHRCWLERSYPQYFFALVVVLVKVTKGATKTTKRAITRDYVDRSIPDVPDVVCDTCGRDGCSINPCRHFLLDIQMRWYPQKNAPAAVGGTFCHFY